MSNADLASFIKRNQQCSDLEMRLETIEEYFHLLKKVGIKRAFLIGSEPTDHSNFKDILDKALELEIDLLVYTSGIALHKLEHSSVKYIVLHLDYHVRFVNRVSIDKI